VQLNSDNTIHNAVDFTTNSTATVDRHLNQSF